MAEKKEFWFGKVNFMSLLNLPDQFTGKPMMPPERASGQGHRRKANAGAHKAPSVPTQLTKSSGQRAVDKEQGRGAAQTKRAADDTAEDAAEDAVDDAANGSTASSIHQRSAN